MILYRPVGLKEMQLIYESGLREFPPRLPEQPIFYPVLNREYAQQIARDWNTKSRFFVGYVTRFKVEDSYAQQFVKHIVGGRMHEELWVPTEKLSNFNCHITANIAVVDAYFGPQFRGYIPERFGMKGRDAIAQFVLLSTTIDDYAMDFRGEIAANSAAVFLHYPFWCRYDFSTQGLGSARREEVLATIRQTWVNLFPELPLCAIEN